MTTFFSTVLSRELEGRVVWYPIGIFIGIISVFEGIYIPPALLILLCAILLIALRYTKHIPVIYFLMVLSAMFIIGYSATIYRIAQVKAPILKAVLSNIWLSGDIEFIDDRISEKRFYITNLSIKQLSESEIPKKIRVNVRAYGDNFKIGDRIRLKCSLLPPPAPAAPGGFDFRRFAYFKQLGGIGYAIAKPILIARPEKITLWQDRVNSWRTNIVNRIKESIPERAGAIAAGLLVGDSSGIDDEAFEAMRIAGTAHLIAISGMHIALVAGMLFVLFRFLLVRVEVLSKQYNVKKYAAVAAILGSYAYLIIAGSPVSAERAFVMSSLVLIASIIDRNVDAMHSLAITSIILLIIQPEDILSPSLQMSIAACVGLIAGFRSSFYICLKKLRRHNLILRALTYLVSVVFATLTAGIATAIFIAYHFNQFSVYSVLANLIAVPLTDFIIMPLGFLGLFLMPMNLEWLALLPMSYGINAMITLSIWVSELNHAAIFVPDFSDIVLSAIIMGGLILCLSVTNIRYIGIPLILLGLYGIYNSAPPDILISSSAELFAVRQDQVLMFSSRSRERFIRRAWMQMSGASHSETLPKNGICNRYTCHFEHGKNKIVIVAREEFLEKECTDSDLFINLTAQNFTCQKSKTNLERQELERRGPYAIYLKDQNIIIENAG